MTADSTVPNEVEVASPTAQAADSAGTEAKAFVRVALVFLAVSVVLGALAGIQLLVPELFAGVAVLSYGRLAPVATNLFVYGWLTIGLAGALLHVVGRSGNMAAPRRLVVRGSLAMLVIGVLAGTVGVALGFSEGRQYLEYPLWADVFLLDGVVGVAWTVTSMARRAPTDAGPVRWYAVAALWWFALLFTAGNVPGIAGVAGAFQSSFYRAGLIGLWLASAGVAVVYHLIPRVAGREAFAPTRLTLLGFWSLAFTWALTAPANLTYSPAPDWVETLGVLFSIGLLIPPAVIVTDLVLALRRRWPAVAGSTVLRFIVLGGVLFAAWPAANLVVALRASSGVLQFTDWIRGLEIVAFYGVVSSWLAAFAYLAAPDLTGRSTRPGMAKLHYTGTWLGLFVWAGASFLGGSTAGWTWVASANEAAVPAAGVGFANTLAAVEGYYVAAFIGLAIFALAQLVFVVNALVPRGAGAAEAPEEAGDAPVDDELALTQSLSNRRLGWSLVAMFLAAAVMAWIVPWVETAGTEETALADSARRYRTAGEVADGREIYLQEGCWYCHTQEVRPIVTDVGLGPVSVRGDYVYEAPVMFGVQRIGPDLMHVGSRPQTDDLGWVIAYLEDPREQRSYSIMPAYDHLSDADLADLAAYLVASK